MKIESLLGTVCWTKWPELEMSGRLLTTNAPHVHRSCHLETCCSVSAPLPGSCCRCQMGNHQPRPVLLPMTSPSTTSPLASHLIPPDSVLPTQPDGPPPLAPSTSSTTISRRHHHGTIPLSCSRYRRGTHFAPFLLSLPSCPSPSLQSADP